MTQGWEKPPFLVVALTAAMIGVAAGFLAYAAFGIRNTASGIEAIRQSYLESPLVQARLSRPRLGESQPAIRAGSIVTEENLEDVRRHLMAAEGVRVEVVDFDVKDAQFIEAAEAYHVPFKITLSGTFPDVVSYVNAVDRAPWLLTTEEVRIAVSPETASPSVTRATIVGFAFWR